VRHRKKGRKFGRKSNIRKAFEKSLVVALVDRKKITTTEARAKFIRSKVERLVTIAKDGDLASIKRLNQYLPKMSAIRIQEIAKDYKDRRGGYTRINKITPRANDKAKRAIIEFI
jgi:large subunit ribosomal protein L17